MLSQRIKNTSEPPLVELGNLVNNTPRTISLAQGVPYYQPEKKYIDEVFSDFSKSEFHRYTQDPGIPELRKEIARKIKDDFDVQVNSQNIVVTNGANQAFVNSLLTITDPGDKIGLITPYYFNHKMASTFSNVKYIEINMNDDFTLSQENLESAINKKIRAIVLVNPGNPTGTIHSVEEIGMLVDLIEDEDIWLISDETYEYFTYEGKFIPTNSFEKIRDKIITITSFSKTYGIPGWRLGYYHGNQEFIKQSMKVQDTTTICAPAVSQYLGIKLLENRQDIIPNYVELMRSNYHIAKDLIKEVSWMEEHESKAAYYFFPRQLTGQNTEKLARALITDHKVALVPGSYFGSKYSDYFRISFANVREEELKEAFSRLKKVS